MRLSFDLSTSDFPDWDGAAIEQLAIEYCERGENLLDAQEYTQAKSAYQIAIECNPNLAISHSGMARAEYQLGNYQAALVAVNHAIDCDERIDFYYQRALITKALNDAAAALPPLPERSGDEGKLSRPDRVSVDLDDDRLALGNFDRHIATHPTEPYGYFFRGMCYDKMEHHLLALADFDRAIALKPEESLFHHARGRTYRAIGNFTAAMVDYDLVIQLEPKLAYVYIDRAEINHLTGDCQQALADCNRAIALNPQLITAYFQRGIAQAELGDLKAALADYCQIITLDSQHIGAYIQRSWIYFRRGEYPRAIADCEFINSVDEDYFQAHYLLGVIHSISGKKTEAIENFTRAIELAPNYVAARYHLGVIYYEFSNLDCADREFDLARSIQASRLEQLIDLDETALSAEGLALYYQGKLELARTMLNLAALFAKRFENTLIHSEVLQFIHRNYSI